MTTVALPTMPRNQRPRRPEDLVPVVVIDTREKKPYWFAKSVVKSLKTGDYSIEGLEDRVTAERKSHQDCFSSMGLVRPRFQREMERMAEFEYAAVVIESTLPGIIRGSTFGAVAPGSVVNALLTYSVRFNVHIIFAGDRRHGNAATDMILGHFWRYRRRAG